MHVLVVSRVDSSMPPLVYGPFDSEDDAEQEWERMEGVRFLFDDLVAHHVMPLQQASSRRLEPVGEPNLSPIVIKPTWIPYPVLPVYQPWIYYNQPYPYRVTWSNGTYAVDGGITP